MYRVACPWLKTGAIIFLLFFAWFIWDLIAKKFMEFETIPGRNSNYNLTNEIICENKIKRALSGKRAKVMT